jgi:predicted naringenin-chalcone synthase
LAGATTISSALRECSRALEFASDMLVRPIDWYLAPLGWPERTSAYLEGACRLFVDAANKALEAAELHAAEVDTIVTISSTGIATPNRKRVRRLMRVMGIEALVPRPGTSKAAPGHKIYPYLLRGLKIVETNHVWAADVSVPQEAA